MKLLQVPFCFYPDPVGGTEVYVEALSREFQKKGAGTVVAAPTKSQEKSYSYAGLKVRRYTVSNKIEDLSELYGEGDIKGAIEFGKILDEEKPDIVHLHAFTRGVSLRLVREAKKRKISTVFTYHTPTVSCQRGTLMRWGKKVCDGKLRLGLCTRCTLRGLGLPRGVSDVFGMAPVGMDNVLRRFNLSGGVWTCLRMRGLISLRHKTFRDLMNEADHVIALCRWAEEVLLINGVPQEKITLIRHGLSRVIESDNQEEAALLSIDDRPLRVVYMGRLSPVKGADTLIRAIRSAPNLPIELHVYGVVQSEGEKGYLEKLKQLVGNDSRIVFEKTVSNEEVIPLLKKYHILAVPSRTVETGPLVVLEAFAAGIPVIGSNLGGIVELVTHKVDGLLVEAGSVKAWAGTLQKLYEDKDLLIQLQTNIHSPGRTEDMIEEIMTVYRALLEKKEQLA